MTKLIVNKKAIILGSVWGLFSLLVILFGGYYSVKNGELDMLLMLGIFSAIITLPIMAERKYVSFILFMITFLSSLAYALRAAGAFLVVVAWSGNTAEASKAFQEASIINAGYAFFVLFSFVYLIAYSIVRHRRGMAGFPPSS